MMWSDNGFLLSKSKYNENSLIAEIYTEDHGKVSGIIFGGTSKKIKNYLQIGNNLHVNFNSKTENRIGYFKIEIQQAFSPYFFDSQKKLSCISSAINLIKLLTAEYQPNQNIYKLIEDLYVLLKKDCWIIETSSRGFDPCAYLVRRSNTLCEKNIISCCACMNMHNHVASIYKIRSA